MMNILHVYRTEIFHNKSLILEKNGTAKIPKTLFNNQESF